MRAFLSRLKKWVYQTPTREPVEPVEPVMTLQSVRSILATGILNDDTYIYLIDRANSRDQLFKDAESAILGRNYTEALALVREGWQLRGR